MMDLGQLENKLWVVDFSRIGENVDPSGVELLGEFLDLEASRRIWDVVDNN